MKRFKFSIKTLNRLQGLTEFLLIILIFTAVASFVMYTGLKYGTVEQRDGSCVKPVHSGFFTFGINRTEEQLKNLASMSTGSDIFSRRMFTHFLKDFTTENFIFSPSSIYVTLGMVALNFGHDKEAVLELQQGGALACDLKVLSLEMKKFLDDNRFLNEMFLHFSLDDDNDDDVPVANLFKISKMRDVNNFRSTADVSLSSSEFQTRLELDVSFGETKFGISSSGNFSELDLDEDERSDIEDDDNSLTFICANGSVSYIDYLKSDAILCTKNEFQIQIILPRNELAVEVMETRFGGFESLQSEIPTGSAQYKEQVGPINLTIPNVGFRFSFELSRPLQSFGVIKMFNDGLERKDCFENLIATEMWHSAVFESKVLRKTFEDVDQIWTTSSSASSPVDVICDRPFFFFLKNVFSDVIQIFGRVKQHEFFNKTTST